VRAKVSLGTNPWNQADANQNLASLAENSAARHPRVSAISFEPGDLPRAREVARGLAATLPENKADFAGRSGFSAVRQNCLSHVKF